MYVYKRRDIQTLPEFIEPRSCWLSPGQMSTFQDVVCWHPLLEFYGTCVYGVCVCVCVRALVLPADCEPGSVVVASAL